MTVSASPRKIPDINRMRGWGQTARTAAPSSVEVTPNHAAPARSQQRRARQHIVAVRIGLDHRHQVSLGACHAAQFFIIGEQPVARELQPKAVG